MVTSLTYTTDELLSFTKKRVMEIARELDIKGRTKMEHHDLIDKIVKLTPPQELMQEESNNDPIELLEIDSFIELYIELTPIIKSAIVKEYNIINKIS